MKWVNETIQKNMRKVYDMRKEVALYSNWPKRGSSPLSLLSAATSLHIAHLRISLQLRKKYTVYEYQDYR